MPINSANFVIPETDFSGVQRTLENRENRMSRQQELEYRREQERQMELWRKTKLIQEETNPDKLATGDLTVDDWVNKNARQVMVKLASNPNLANMGYNEVLAETSRDWLPLAQKAQVLKSGLSRIDVQTKQLTTKNPYLSAERLAMAAKKSLVDDILPEVNGERDYSMQNYKPDRDYLGELTTPENLWKYIASPEKLGEKIAKTKTEPIDVLRKKFAGGTEMNYIGQKSPFTELNVTPDLTNTIKAADNPEFKVTSKDDFVTENGQKVPVKVLGDAAWENLFEGEENIENAASLKALFEMYKEQNKVTYDTPSDEMKAIKAYALDVVQRHDPSRISAKELKNQPRNEYRIYTGSGTPDKNAGANWVKRAVDAMKGTDQQKRVDVFSELLAGDMKELKGVEDFGDGKVKVTILPKPKYTLEGNIIPESLLEKTYTYDINDRQVPYKLANLRQTIMGGDVNLERTQFERAKTDTKKQTGKYPLPKGKPEEIEQNGYKYKWNVNTGKYE